jgi:Xaa-Pro aminopeptidase
MMSALDGIAPSDVGSRIERVKARLAHEFGADAMLVSSATNIRYLTGFAGVSAGLLLLPDRLALIADRRYRTRALQAVSAPHMSQIGIEVIDPSERTEVIKRSLPTSARMVIEENNMVMAEYTRLTTELPVVELVPAGDIVLEERLVKDAGEVARIRAAGAISDAAVEDLIAAVPIGWSELEIAAFLIERMIAFGAERAAFEPMVATAERSALAHSHPSRERLEEDMILLIDFGAEVDGYKADMTRTLWWGELAPDVSAAFDAVRKAYDAAAAELHPGASPESIDSASRTVLREHELEQFVIHPCGHNIGLDIHEQPYFSSQFRGELATGNVVTVEPGVYIPDVGGIRLEDTFLVTDSGPLPITMSPRGGQSRAVDAGPVSHDGGDRAPAEVAGPRIESDETEFSQVGVELEKVDDHRRFLLGDRAPWRRFDELKPTRRKHQRDR